MQSLAAITRIPPVANYVFKKQRENLSDRCLESTVSETNLKMINQSHYRPEVPRGFQEVKVPRLRDNGPGWW